MRIAIAQMTVDKDPKANLRKLDAHAQDAAGRGARLLLAPEGVISRDPDDPDATRAGAQPFDGPFVEELEELSAKHGIAIAATVHLTEDDKVVNAFLIVDGGVVVSRYDKLHLYDAFSQKESDTVTAGTELPPVVELDGWKFGLVTCYDVRFPEHARHLALAGADVLLVAAAWVKGPLKEHHWQTLCTTRALDNTVYVAACGELSARNIGMSAVIDPMGRTVVAAAEEETLIVADLSHERIAQVREKLPVLANRRFDAPTLSR